VTLERADFVWAAAAGAAAFALFASTLTSHPALGDAPETVAGVKSLGILHAPGYPSYVLAARLFSLLPFGSEALRVNMFSAVCGALFVAGVVLLARRCGAARWASAFGALCLATGAAFWFYAGFAKHDLFSGLLALIVLYLAIDLDIRAAEQTAAGHEVAAKPDANRTLWALTGLGVAFGLGLAASWPLLLLTLPTVLVVLFRSARSVGGRGLVAALLSCLIVSAASYGFVLFRASEHPAVSWGEATNFHRLVNLIDRSDFSPTHSPASPSPFGSRGTGAGQPGPHRAQYVDPHALASRVSEEGVLGSNLSNKVGTNFAIFFGELGFAGVALAGLGALGSLLAPRRRATLALAITFLVGLFATAARVGKPRSLGYDTDLLIGGFLLTCYVPLGCWIALGSEDLWRRASRVLKRWSPLALRLGAAAAALLAAAVLATSALSHRAVMDRAARPLADYYARTVFSELPRNAVVGVWNAEFSQPLIYRQVVFHERPDVTVVVTGALSSDWYREQLARRLHRSLPPKIGDSVADARAFVHSLQGVRPLYLDMNGARELQSSSRPGEPVGYVPIGLVARVVAGAGFAQVASPAALARSVSAAESAAGMPGAPWRVWPNSPLSQTIYASAVLEVVLAYAERHDYADARRWVGNLLAIDPTYSTARQLQQFLAQQGQRTP
jgi:hypothetical protein